MGKAQSGGPRAAGRRGFAPALLAAGFLLLGCTAAKHPGAGAAAGDAPQAQPATAADTARSAVLDRALRRFETAVIERDTALFMDLLDGHYRKVEFEGFFRGVTPQFLNEFFCGKTPKGDQAFCLPFDGISELKRLDLTGGEEQAKVEYAVKTSESEIRALVQVNLDKGGQVRGFIGPNGYTQVE